MRANIPKRSLRWAKALSEDRQFSNPRQNPVEIRNIFLIGNYTPNLSPGKSSDSTAIPQTTTDTTAPEGATEKGENHEEN